jgi:ERCC4-type nuclease
MAMAGCAGNGPRTYLVVDARERGVIPFVAAELRGGSYVVKQVTTADYLICQQGGGGAPRVLAAIERKTHEDFAASFKDGRYENVKKMRALRAATGCLLFYFIEGAAFPSPGRRFAGIPFGNILAAVTKLMVRDGVFIVQTEDERHSAKRLADFLRVFETETPYGAGPAAGADPGGGDGGESGSGGGESGSGGGESGSGGGESGGGESGGGESGGDGGRGDLTVPDILMARVAQTDGEAAVDVWARLRGVSVVLGKILTQSFTVADLAAQKVSPEQIRTMKTATGRTINKDAVASLLAVRAGKVEHAVKLVSGLRNITPATASVLLEAVGGLPRLCSQPPAVVAAIRLPRGGQTAQLGATRAERIQRVLNYREGRPPAPAQEPAAQEPAAREPPGAKRAEPILDSDIDDILAGCNF